jgi:hypothetical protein
MQIAKFTPLNRKTLRPVILKDDHAEVLVLDKDGTLIVSFIDLEDVDKVKHRNWSIGSGGYPIASENYKHIRIHRLVMKPPQGMVVDHIDGDKLDNRKSNLRICTQQENKFARHAVDAKSGYKGVYYQKGNGRWWASVQARCHIYHLGRFDSAEKAALAYNDKALELFGEFAVLNEVNT